ncbi:response regulator transcription factor [Paracidobacterium acidisoli]|uniref:response regulator transcription factor n=1 Tax=Paracidobacterium acidisoli TaxID=2303751 RepID=UPI001314B39C|nr:response regulator transcription factor [Paracidobacterium acidisoli]
MEDELRLAELLRHGLREHGYAVMTASYGEEALALACEHAFDVVVLDIMLPGISGWSVMSELRRRQNTASVLMLTACDSEPDVIHGLESGADDYLTKPFSFQELLARLHCLARARSSLTQPLLVLDNLVLDLLQHRAWRAGQKLDLTRTEFGLLSCLLQHQGRVVSRLELLQMVWGSHPPDGRSALDSFISLLRRKIDVPGERKLMHTVKGTGYSVYAEERKEHEAAQE